MVTLVQLVICVGFLMIGVRKQILFSEIAVTSLILMFVIAGCVWVHFAGSYLTSGGGIPPVILMPEEAEQVASIFFEATISLLIGGYLTSLLPRRLSHRPLQENSTLNLSQTKLDKPLGIISTILVFSFVVLNFRPIVSRHDYLFVGQGSISGALRYLIPMIGLVCAWLMVSASSKFLPRINFVACLLIEFSASSRSIGILLLGFFVFWAAKAKTKLLAILRLICGAYLGALGIGQALYLRSQEMHGLIPHALSISKHGFTENTIGTVIGTFLVIIPVTLFGLQVSTPHGYLEISINPLPGRMTNWYSIADNLNLNPWTPTGAVAQIHNLGFLPELLIWLSLGFLLCLLGKFSHTYRNFSVVPLISTALVLSASLQFLQYSLRAGMRFLYADLLFLFILKLVNGSKSRFQNRLPLEE